MLNLGANYAFTMLRMAMCALMLLFASTVLADTNNLFGSDQPPLQSFQEAGTPQKTAPATTASNKDKKKETQQSTAQAEKTTADKAANANSVPSPTTTNNAADQKTIAALQQTVATLTQTVYGYQQRNDQRFTLLNQQIQQLQSHVTQLTQAMSLMDDELKQALNAASASTPAVATDTNTTQPITEHLNNVSLIIIALTIIIIAGLITWWVRQGRKPTITHSNLSAHETLHDDTLQAKLDLARAYFNMEDYDSCRETLTDVLHEAGPTARREAERMLAAIKQRQNS